MLEKDTEKSRTFTRRALLVGAGQAALLGVLGVRLAYLQVAEGQKYKTLSDKNRINLKILAPSRGQIVDRFGVPLAVNQQDFRVLLTPEQAGDVPAVLKILRRMITLSDRQIEAAIEKAGKVPAFVPVEVRDNLSWTDVARLEVHMTDLPGISIDVGERRIYPFADAAAHLAGYVGAVSKTDLAEDDPVLRLPAFKIGKSGIEKLYDKDLRGTAGAAQIEVNVRGREVRELTRQPGRQGARVMLTIDADLQRRVQERLAAVKSASAVIMDVKTGAVYALCSSPSFDPNLFTSGLSAEKWEELLSDPAYPLNNKAISGQYPPGSTFKMITALATLEDGTANKYTTVHCPGYFLYGGDKFRCWKYSGHGHMNLEEALRESCDTYFYKLSSEIGIEKIADMARRFGLGHKTGFELKEENSGLMPDKAWKMGYFGQPWRGGETIVASIGQGYILATPLQLAVMTARLVNGGRAVRPWVTGYVGDIPMHQNDWPSMNISNEHLGLVLKGMNSVVNHPKGTAYDSRFQSGEMTFGGKTGTSQVRRITTEQRLQGVRNEDLPWKYRDHALFVGYAPADAPRYACAIVVEHGGGGSSAAAPIARDLLAMTMQRHPAARVMRPDKPARDGGPVIPPRKPGKPEKNNEEDGS